MASDFTRRGFLKGGLAATTSAAVLRGAAAQAAPPTGDDDADGGLESVTVQCTVNGSPAELVVGEDDSAVEAIRDRLGLTGAKQGCGHGACGACTVLVDGAPHASCLLPAVALEGAAVTTVEGIAAAGGLHPVQRAFLAHDAMQCGFCTPGFVVEATAFYDRWRADNGAAAPSREAVADALEGHVCRCGAYPNIYAAVIDACAGKFDDSDLATGPRVDGPEKVTGAATYTVDVMLDGQLEAAVLRSPHGRATLTALDLSGARQVKGVSAVVALTPVGHAVRYFGQEIAAVAATDRATAEAAAQAIVATYDVAAPVLGIPAGRDPSSAPVYDGKKAQKRELVSASEGPVLKADWEGNVRGPTDASFFSKPKRAEKALEEGGFAASVEGTWKTQVQCHSTLEPHAAVADWKSDSDVTLYASTQSCGALADDVADRWDLKREAVRVHCPYVGGGFGGKVGLQMESRIALELSREAGKPVRVVLSRADELAVGGIRPGQEIELAMGADSDGALVAHKVDAYTDSGVAAGSSLGLLMRVIYPSDKSVRDFDIMTNAPPGKPFRAPSGPPAFFALEQAVDQMAAQLGRDPIGLRKAWDVNPARLRLLDWAATLPAWKERDARTRDRGRYRRGVGLSSGGWLAFIDRNAQVQIDAGPDGIVASAACQDMGNGARSVVAWAVADELDLEPGDITVRFGDSNDVTAPMSAGSRTAASIAPAAREAAARMVAELEELATDQLGLSGVHRVKGGLQHASGYLSWAELLSMAPKITVVGKRRRDPGGYYLPFSVGGLRIGKQQTGAVQVSEVEVDTRLGRVRVVETWIGIGVGKIMVPAMARNQVEGGVVQGISYALYEERRLDPRTGRLLTAGLEDYRIAGLGDIPPIHVHFDEEGFDDVLGGGAGLAELATLPAAGSIANAVHHATGWRPTELPLRIDRVLRGVQA